MGWERTTSKVIVFSFAFSVLLISMLGAPLGVYRARASGTIYIRADGNIDPPTANITTTDNVTYTFTDNNYDSIVIERSDTIVDGNGFALQGGGNGTGFDLRKSGITIRNTEITAFSIGVNCVDVYGGQQIVNNTITNTWAGVYISWLVEVTWADIINNTIANNGIGIYIGGFCGGWSGRIIGNTIGENNRGIMLSYVTCQLRKNVLLGNGFSAGGLDVGHYSHDIDESNTIDGKPIYYWRNQKDRSVPLDAGYVALISCENITVENLTLTNNGEGVVLVNTSNSVVRNMNIIGNSVGIVLLGASQNRIYANNVTSPSWGLFSGGFNENNHIYHNNFVDYSEIWLMDECRDVWDAGYPRGGNYWSGYNGSDVLFGAYQNFNGSDGIGDTPFVFRDTNGEYNYTDRYPLIEPWTSSWQPIPPFLTGDVNYDGKVDIYDAVLICGAYLSTPLDPRWNPQCDIAEPYGIINIYDAVLLCGHYGEQYEP